MTGRSGTQSVTDRMAVQGACRSGCVGEVEWKEMKRGRYNEGKEENEGKGKEGRKGERKKGREREKRGK